MKINYFISLQKGFLALMSVALLFSCSQIEPFEMEGNDKVLLSVVSTSSPIGGGNCEVDCITDDESTWKVKKYTQDYDDNEGTITIEVYNSPTKIYYKITSTTTIRQVNFGGVSKYASSTAATQPFIITEDLGEFGEDWEACEEEAVAITVKRNNVSGIGGGVSQTVNTSYNLIGVCQGCEDEFSAVLNCTNPNAKTLTVTFTAENAGDYVIQGGLTNGAAIIGAVATADFEENTEHPSAGGPSSVTRWEGSLDDCETVTVTITYSGGSGVGSWSAKSIVDGVEVVNGESEDQDCD